MKKICFFIRTISGDGGTERMSSLIANELANSGYEVHILSMYKGTHSYYTIDKKVKLSTIKDVKASFSLKYFTAVRAIRSYVKEHKIDTIIDVDTILSLFSTVATIGINIQHASWEHFNYKSDFGLIKRRLSRHVARLLCDDIIVLTERDKQFWEEQRFNNAKVSVISNPSPYQKKQYCEDINAINQSKNVIAVGRLVNQKGFDHLLDGWSRISKKYPDWTLKLIGSGPLENDIRMLIDQLDIKDSVQMIPSTKSIHEYYKESTIYCLTSRFEGLPMVLIEALHFGLPIVAYDCDTGPAEIVTDGENGFLCKTGNVSDFSNKLAALMGDEVLRQKFSNSAFERSSKFNIENVLEKWIELINGCSHR